MRKLILIVNDDGITAPGIRALAESVVELGDVVVVAPDSAQSGKSNALTIDKNLEINTHDFPVEGVKGFSTSGTPVDCVKLAISKVLDRKPDLLVSGVNHGSNHSINVIYSGTMGAATEGTVEGIPSVGFSLLDHNMDADFTVSKKVAKTVAEEILKNCLPQGVSLNVNIPKIDESEFKGLLVCRQSKGHWVDGYEDVEGHDGKTRYMLKGEFKNPDNEEGTDEYALKNGYASVVPTQFDLTAHNFISELGNWEF